MCMCVHVYVCVDVCVCVRMCVCVLYESVVIAYLCVTAHNTHTWAYPPHNIPYIFAMFVLHELFLHTIGSSDTFKYLIAVFVQRAESIVKVQIWAKRTKLMLNVMIENCHFGHLNPEKAVRHKSYSTFQWKFFDTVALFWVCITLEGTGSSTDF